MFALLRFSCDCVRSAVAPGQRREALQTEAKPKLRRDLNVQLCSDVGNAWL